MISRFSSLLLFERTWNRLSRVINKKRASPLGPAIPFLGIFPEKKTTRNSKTYMGTSFVVQWVRIQVWSPVQENSTCPGATKPVQHGYWGHALETMSWNCWAHGPQFLKPRKSRACALKQEDHHNEKPAHHSERVARAPQSQRKPTLAETRCAQK